MPFNGDFDSIVTDDNAKEELQRLVRHNHSITIELQNA